MMGEPSITTLIGDVNANANADVHANEISMQGNWKWSAFVDGQDGFLYGVPSGARRVAKFNPVDKSMTMIGPDLGEGGIKWRCGVLARNGAIYCVPYYSHAILKIDTNDGGTVIILEDVQLPETGDALWTSGCLAADQCIYYMPYNARRILRLNPDNDSVSSVGVDLGEGLQYKGAVVGNDECIYGIPWWAKQIVKFDPRNPDSITFVGEEADERFYCWNGVLGEDGFIYTVNGYGQILRIDTTMNRYEWIGDKIYFGEEPGWGNPIIGSDRCIYCPPRAANRALKFNPSTELQSLVGDDLSGRKFKWMCGALATDGAIYCVPWSADQVLSIDPLRELTMTMEISLKENPEQLGCLFVKDKYDEGQTFYESGVQMFGSDKIFKLIDEHLPSDEYWSRVYGTDLPLFLLAASCENSATPVIYHLLRRNVQHALLETRSCRWK